MIIGFGADKIPYPKPGPARKVLNKQSTGSQLLDSGQGKSESKWNLGLTNLNISPLPTHQWHQPDDMRGKQRQIYGDVGLDETSDNFVFLGLRVRRRRNGYTYSLARLIRISSRAVQLGR